MQRGHTTVRGAEGSITVRGVEGYATVKGVEGVYQCLLGGGGGGCRGVIPLSAKVRLYHCLVIPLSRVQRCYTTTAARDGLYQCLPREGCRAVC